MSVDYLLHESSLGYAIFKVNMQPDTVGNNLKEYQKQMQDLATFGKMVKLVSFAPFQGAQQALENANDISEGIVSDFLQTVLETNLPKPDKKHKVTLGVADRTLAGGIKTAFPGVECETAETSDVVGDMLRGLRLHAEKLLKQLQEGDVDRAQLGLGHAYSRGKVKFSVNRNDNHIIQAIATLDHLDKAVNQFSMRVREWYSWHFPELIKIVSENQQYARVALFIGDKKSLSEDRLHEVAALVNDDEAIAKSIIDAAKVSMGQDISDHDMENVMAFAKRVVSLGEYRKNLSGYLIAKMSVVAPNLAALIGETVGARLISHAGSLTNLAKYPASTVQILGAEKALFRALKTKGATPKYGLIYHSSFIGRAGLKNKGRISRFLANKASIASRIDNFAETPNTKFGEALKAQVEERLAFYATGATPMKNSDAMKAAMDSVLQDINVDDMDVDDDDDEPTKKVIPPVDESMEAILPVRPTTNPSKGEEKKEKDLSKKERKAMKKEKKKAKERPDEGDDEEGIRAEPEVSKYLEEEEKKEKKHKKDKKRKHDHDDSERKKKKKEKI